MTRVNGLLFGTFITSCVLSFGLWINSQVNLNVEFIENIPARVLSTSETDLEARRIRMIAENKYVSAGDKGSNISYTWQAPNDDRAESFKSLLSTELAEYSEEYLEAIGLNEIILVSQVQTIGGTPVLGFADPLRGQLYLNTIEVEGEFSRAIVAEQTLHHELAHLLAYELYGYGFERNSSWAKEVSFEYGKHNHSNSEYFPHDGFVSAYSMRSASEDFAEVYSLIFTDYFRPPLEQEASKSDMLREKVAFVYDSINDVSSDQCLQSPRLVPHGCDQE